MLPGSGREMSLAPFSSQNQRLSKKHQYQSFGTIVLISAAKKMKNTKKCGHKTKHTVKPCQASPN